MSERIIRSPSLSIFIRPGERSQLATVVASRNVPGLRPGYNYTRIGDVGRQSLADPGLAQARAPKIGFEKRPGEMAQIGAGPCIAIDASIDSELPMATVPAGGPKVDERSGPCSNIDVSGLSYADCVFSGRRVARHAAPPT